MLTFDLLQWLQIYLLYMSTTDLQAAKATRVRYYTTSPLRLQCLLNSKDKPERENTFRLTCSSKENSNQPVPSRSLITAFVVSIMKLCIVGYPKCTQWRFWSACGNAGRPVHRYVFRHCGSYQLPFSDIVVHIDFRFQTSPTCELAVIAGSMY